MEKYIASWGSHLDMHFELLTQIFLPRVHPLIISHPYFPFLSSLPILLPSYPLTNTLNLYFSHPPLPLPQREDLIYGWPLSCLDSLRSIRQNLWLLFSHLQPKFLTFGMHLIKKIGSLKFAAKKIVSNILGLGLAVE